MLEQIRSRADIGSICVIMLTATDDPAVIVNTFEYKPNAYLRKMDTDPRKLYITLARELSRENPHMLRPIRVFLCHSHVDKPFVRELYYRLKRDFVEPWLDEKELVPGQDWDLEIRKAVLASDIVAVCLSHQASQPGFLQREIRYVLDAADQQPEGAIFVIPVLLEACNVPSRLAKWHWIDFAREDGYGQLMRSIPARTKELGLN